MDKKRLYKYIGLGVICLILFPFAPFILGAFVIYKIVKSGIPKLNKIIAAFLTIVVAFIFTSKIANVLPKTPQPSPTPVITPEPESSPQPIVASPTPQLNSNLTFAKVTHVVDGDTFTLESGEVVRMIGIDTPETVHPSKPVQCYGNEASQKTHELLEGKDVKLEKDVSETDKYKRLLRYVYIDDVLINEYLVAEGFARSSSYPPDVKYQSKFIEAEKLARAQNKGLWNKLVCPEPTPVSKTTIVTSTNSPTVQKNIQAINNTTGGYTCDCSKTCTKMSCSEAQYQLSVCGCRARDADGDGTACDSQCQ